ncbi:TRAP transporter small permease [Pseudoroseomonas globiformis]|uniref:TRAP transporter small permease protein n=1 Tax=Teichococcus globiformis TaxID=2307229 RepID=A0ABV7FYE7_9PROT
MGRSPRPLASSGGGAPSPERRTPHGALITVTATVERGIAVLCQGVLLVAGTGLMVVMTANVVARYILASGGFDWAEEVPQQLFPWFIMAGVALAVQRGGHIAVEWLMGFLGRNGRRVLLLLGHALVAIAYLILCWQALEVAEIVAIERSPALGLPGSYGYWAIAAGCVLIAIGTVAIAIRIALIGPEALPTPRPEEMPT